VNAVQMELIPTVAPTTERRILRLDELPLAHVGSRAERDLIENIKVFRVQVPIVVRERDGAYILVDGRRRVAAQRIALEEIIKAHGADSDEAEALRTIKAEIISGVTAAMASVLTIGLHATRRENPASELEAIEDLLKIGAQEADICEATGLQPHQVRARLRLQRLTPALRAAFSDGRITHSTAADAARLPLAMQKKLEGKLTPGERLTSKDVRAARSAQAVEATGLLPDDIFAPIPEETDSSSDTVTVVAIAEFVQSRAEGEWRRILSDDAVLLLEELIDLLPENLRP
jgi:ParB-like chromosome segregation protein Spo0J